jgi:hypothetical protein
VSAVVVYEALRAISVAGEGPAAVVLCTRCVVAVLLAVTRRNVSLPRHPCGSVPGPAKLALGH